MSGSGWKKAAYTVYEDSALTTVAEQISYQNCTITKIAGNAVNISYKVNGQKKSGWLPLATFIYDVNYAHQIAYANDALTIYRQPKASSKTTKIKLYSGGLVVGEKGNWKQVLFKSGSKYQLGWIKNTSFTAQVRLSMETTTQVLANATYIITPRNSSGSALTYQSATDEFGIAKNTQALQQQFELQHYKSNQYKVTPKSAAGVLALGGDKLTARAVMDNRWFIKRSGAYFYICDSSKKRCLAYSAGKIQIEQWNKTKAEQWRIAKKKETPAKETSVVFSQYDPKWGGSTYYKGANRRTISTSGCGVVALTNAIYALNGEFINPTKIAKFSASKGHYYYMQGTSDTLYAAYAKKYGKTYHFKHSGKVYSLSKLKKHLKKGGTAVALVPGHYIALTAYRASDNKYLVLDSAVYAKRPTTIDGTWIAAKDLQRGYLNCEYFHLFARK